MLKVSALIKLNTYALCGMGDQMAEHTSLEPLGLYFLFFVPDEFVYF